MEQIAPSRQPDRSRLWLTMGGVTAVAVGSVIYLLGSRLWEEPEPQPRVSAVATTVGAETGIARAGEQARESAAEPRS